MSESPINAEDPVIRLMTPGGRISAIRLIVNAGVRHDSFDGFTTTVLPANRACGSLAPRIESGQFHGTTRVATPRGWRKISVSKGGPDSLFSCASLSAK